MDSGWVLGFGIGAAVVLIVVAVVLTIIWLAGAIRDRAERAVQQLVRAESATAPLWHVQQTAEAASGTLAAAGRLREREQRP